MRRLLRRMAVKLTVLCLSFTLPMAVMLSAMIEAKNKDITFARTEIAGNRYIRPLRTLHERLARHWWLKRRAQRGELDLGPQIAAARERVDRAVAALQSVDAELGALLQFTPEGLGKRGRQALSPSALAMDWQRIRDAGGEDASAIDEEHRGLLERVDGIISHAGDTSNLILDPDLDAYYLMDVTLLALPSLSGRLVEGLMLLERAADGGGAALVERALRAAIIAQGEVDRLRESTHRVLTEDENFYGKSASLQAAVPVQARAIAGASAPIIEALRRAGTPGAAAPDGAGLRAPGEAALGDVTRAHLALLDELDGLLLTRIATYENDKRVAMRNSAIALTVALLLAAYISLDLMGRIRRFIDVTRRIAQGDLGARVRSAAGDEIGELSRSFDDMTDRLSDLTAALELRNRELSEVNQGLEDRVRERTSAIQLLLDSIGEALIATDLEGTVQQGRSRRAEEWFGAPPPDCKIWDLVCEKGSPQAEYLRLGFLQLKDDCFPFEVTADQMPQRLTRSALTFAASYKPVLEQGSLRGVLLVVRDATADLERERAEKRSRELQTIIGHLLRDRNGFNQFVQDCSGLVEGLLAGDAAPVMRKRDLHTLKGNTAVYGFLSLAEFCHQIEERMAEEGQGPRQADLEELSRRWGDSIRTIESFFAEDPARMKIQIRDSEYQRLVSDLELRREYEEILDLVRSWQYEHAYSRLSRLRAQAQRVARQLGRGLDVFIEDNEIRLPAELLGNFWSQLIHVVRNAVDHGIEPPEEREGGGKAPTGRLWMIARVEGSELLVAIEDDGRGVDWARVRRRAEKMGLPSATQEDLQEAIFADGLTTREQATELSGRGVGLAAVRAACLALGGAVRVIARPGRGTRFEFRFSLDAHPALGELRRRGAGALQGAQRLAIGRLSLPPPPPPA